MLNKEDCYSFGTLIKTHGIHGEYILRLNNLQIQDIPEMELVFIEINGLLVPFFISYLSENNKTSLIIKFDEINENEQAKEFVGCNVYIPSNETNINSKLLQEEASFLGYEVIDKKHGKVGIIEDYLNIKNNPLMKVRSKEKELLIPYHEDIFQDINDNNKTVYVNLPEGLINI